jgi:hypothetical protein
MSSQSFGRAWRLADHDGAHVSNYSEPILAIKPAHVSYSDRFARTEHLGLQLCKTKTCARRLLDLVAVWLGRSPGRLIRG